MKRAELKRLENFLHRNIEGIERFRLFAYGYLEALSRYKIITKRQFIEISEKVGKGEI